MNLQNNYLNKFRISKRKLTEADVLTEEIVNFFHKKLSFGNVRKIINEIGVRAANDLFIDVKKMDEKYRIGWFIKNSASQKKNIKWKNT